MASINPYLNFPGTTEEAFNFYKSVFGGEFLMVQRFGNQPGCEGQEISESDRDKIMHIALPVGDTVLMATDALESMGQKFAAGNNFSLSISAESEAEADTLFNGLSAGGTAVMPMAKAFWGAYFGVLTDKFGVSWMINYDYGQQ